MKKNKEKTLCPFGTSPLTGRFTLGFTLVELLVVIAIIGILTIVVTASFSSAQQKARDVRRKGELNALSKALQMYYNDTGSFPNHGVVPADLDINTMIAITAPAQDFTVNSYVYMKVLPHETKSGLPPYWYEVSASGKSFNLFAKLENSNDADCKGNAWIRGGNTYCYGLASPNTDVGHTVP